MDRGPEEACFLYLPSSEQGRSKISKASVPFQWVQGLFRLLVRLHDIFLVSSGGREKMTKPPFYVYWDPEDDAEAFNLADELWYNAAHACQLYDLEARGKILVPHHLP